MAQHYDPVNAIKTILAYELEERRPEIEAASTTLTSLGIVIKFDGLGVPRRVIWRPEYHRSFRSDSKELYEP